MAQSNAQSTRTRGEAGIENSKNWREQRKEILLTCEREGHDWITGGTGGRGYCRRCKLPKELSK